MRSRKILVWALDTRTCASNEIIFFWIDCLLVEYKCLKKYPGKQNTHSCTYMKNVPINIQAWNMKHVQCIHCTFILAHIHYFYTSSLLILICRDLIRSVLKLSIWFHNIFIVWNLENPAKSALRFSIFIFFVKIYSYTNLFFSNVTYKFCWEFMQSGESLLRFY